MNKTYIVYKNKAYSNFKATQGGYYLLTRNEQSLSEGFEVYKTLLRTLYRKFIAKEEVEKKYRIIDFAVINEQKYTIFQSSDDNFDQPDSWITIVTDDVEFLKANDIWEGAEVVDNQYGHRFYHSSRIPVSKVTILRTREDLPID